MLLALLTACQPNVAGPDDKPADDSGTDTGDTATTGGTNPGDTVGPDLPACTPQTGSGDVVALSGVVLAPEGPIAGTLTYDAATGEILCVGEACDTAGAEIVCTEGLISAGLVDAHNHLQYNTAPPFQVGPEFGDRYDWQDDGRYWDYGEAFDAVGDDECDVVKWATARLLVHGTTSAVGGLGGCDDTLVRVLDEDHGLPDYRLEYGSGRVTNFDEGDAGDYLADLADSSTDAVEMHVAEGKDGNVRAEIDHMVDIGMEGPGFLYVHTSDATTEQLARMAAAGTAIVWSPRSNLALYATTTPIEIAERLGVPWAIGTDWTPSGSMAPIGELACAAEWLAAKGDPLTDRQLYDKVTTDAARVLGMDGLVGALSPGMIADVAVFTWHRTPYRHVIEGAATDVRLVVKGGQPLYGLDDLLEPLGAGSCERLDVCGASRSVCDDGTPLSEVEATLTAALESASPPEGYEYAFELYGLVDCDDSFASCDLSEPTDGDADGDGVADDGDVCAGVYDPNQWDYDEDGAGDACDDCPLTVEADCAGTAGDLDGDGVANEDDVCPYVSDDQTDTDGDGLGDACDACPEDEGACDVAVEAIQDASHPDHPAEGTAVAISGAVVTAIDAEAGFFVQVPGATQFGGLYVYEFGDNDVSPGDVVTVEGVYEDYYGLAELNDVTSVTVTGTAEVPAPIEVDACDIATGGALADALESMLVTVGAVEVTNANVDDPEDYEEFEVAGCLRVDDMLYAYGDQPAVGTPYTALTGVAVYSFENAKLAPRDAADLQ
jgi:cytosine/adenosine deaminase-related metal-dependent hydrolase